VTAFEDIPAETRIARFSLLNTFTEDGITLWAVDEAVLSPSNYQDEKLRQSAIAFRNAYTALSDILIEYAQQIPNYPEEASSAGIIETSEESEDAAQRVIDDITNKNDFE